MRPVRLQQHPFKLGEKIEIHFHIQFIEIIIYSYLFGQRRRPMAVAVTTMRHTITHRRFCWWRRTRTIRIHDLHTEDEQSPIPLFFFFAGGGTYVRWRRATMRSLEFNLGEGKYELNVDNTSTNDSSRVQLFDEWQWWSLVCASAQFKRAKHCPLDWWLTGESSHIVARHNDNRFAELWTFAPKI